MAFIRGNERERIQSNWPTGWRWPGNVPANVVPPDELVGKGVEFITLDQPYRSPQPVLRSPPIIAAAIVTAMALGQITVPQSAPQPQVQQAVTRGSVLPDLVYPAFGGRIVVPPERVALAPAAIRQFSSPLPELSFANKIIVRPQAPPEQSKPIQPMVRPWAPPGVAQVPPLQTRVIVPQRRPDDSPNETSLAFFTPRYEPLLGSTLIVAQSRPPETPNQTSLAFFTPKLGPRGELVVRPQQPNEQRQPIRALLRWGVPANFVPPISPPTINRLTVRQQQPVDQSRPLLRWGVPADFIPPASPPTINKIVVPPERYGYAIETLAYSADSTVGVTPPQDPPPFGRIFTRQEFKEPWILNLGGLVTLATPPSRPLIVARYARAENIQPIARSTIITSLVYPAFGGRAIVLREQLTRGDLQALLRWGQPIDVAPAQIPPFKPLVVGQQRREDIQALLRWSQPANVVPPQVPPFPPLVVRQERKEDIQPLLRWGMPLNVQTPQYNAAFVRDLRPIDQKGAITRGPQVAQLVYPAFGGQVVKGRELPVYRENGKFTYFSGFVPPDFVPVIAAGLRRKRHWRRGSS